MLGTCATHERTYLPSAVFDTGILQSEKRQLDEFASCGDEGSAILVSDAELYVVKPIDVFEEGARSLWS